MAAYIPHKCSRCFSDVVLIQPENNDGMLKKYMRGECRKCMTRIFIDLNESKIIEKPVSERALISTAILEELAVADMDEIKAVITLLKKKGLLSKDEVMKEIEGVRRCEAKFNKT